MIKAENKQYILMGDVVSSTDYHSKPLQKNLKALTKSCNESLEDRLLSPYTVTLGDEFQGIPDSLQTAIETLFFCEEECLRQSYGFKLHYVVHYGEIETDINPDIAYEMMGPGLSKARKLLSSKKRSRKRFQFALADAIQSQQITRLFEVLDSLILSWKQDDYDLILDMIENENNAEVGEKHGKNRDQIWKRRKTLMINEYNLLKEFLFTYIKES
ncbi:SatD family protein [Gracilimonas mengyeensis]|uniref:SatD family (SatD) n=1 Tax=Gracilimonas mengyeensis TaxID=1302730 RepID=A0A521AE24_9BACT|nr:SatD family protein [Gracilimonas mengyeensis]SMO33031.1 SatD family (SatD) [Gracilimonas mengyeensis]